MKRLPLRWILLGPTLVAITIGFGAFGLFIDRVERENLMADIDAELVRAERTTATLPSVPPPGRDDGVRPAVVDAEAPAANGDGGGGEGSGDGDPTAPIQLLIDGDGQVLARGTANERFDADTLGDLAGRNGAFTVDDPRYRVRATTRDDGTTMITALSLDLFDDSIDGFRRSMLGGALIILSLVSAILWALTAVVVRPISRMASAATAIADGALDTDIDASPGSRETAELAHDLDLMLLQLRSVIDDRESAAAEATAARDEMERFLADVSHELRTPLTSLKGYSDLYAGNMLTEPGAVDRAMARIGDESTRLHALVNDMLQLARQFPESEVTEPVDMVGIVEVVVEDLRVAYPDIEIDVDLPTDAASVVDGRPGPLHQALLNVGGNACQHTTPGSPVRFALRTLDADLLIEVVDHGPGIDPSEFDKVFLPFYRHDASRGRDGRGGAGLGLAITHQIVERHHGTIVVGETPGGGATFTLTLPLASR